MSDDQGGQAADAEQGGVFGKLPASRPGTRSPRRGSTAKAVPKPKSAQAAPKPRTPVQEPGAAPEAADETLADQGGLDDLAWAGVAAVAEAATLGVRLANRAFGALRDGVDRR